MDLQDAINYIIACRDTHVDVVDYYDAGCTAQDWLDEYLTAGEALGNRGFHQDCIDDYNRVIKVLQEVSNDR